MEWTEANLTALESAIAQGVLTVEAAGKRVTYRSLDEMLRIRDLMRKALGKVSPGSTTVYTKFSKGL